MGLVNETYKNRIVDKKISELMRSFGAVCVEGPKWCGKTWASLNQAESVSYIADPANGFQNRRMAEISPELVLEGAYPRVIDEWQEVPEIWDAVRFAVDKDGKKGKFILTGSSTPKRKERHFVDPSLAVAALSAAPDMLKNDLNTFGFIFEALCEHDLKIYALSHDGKLFHFRDDRGNEIDAVVELPDGRWGAFEIKLGANQIDAAAEELLKIRKIMENEGSTPSALCVICGMSNMAYKRKDGVFVVPITALRD